MKRFMIWALLALMWLVIFLPEGLTQGSDMRLRDAFVYRKLDGRGGIPMFWDGFIVGNYAGTSRDCILFNYTGSGHYIIQLQGDGTRVFSVDKSGNLYSLGGVAVGSLDLADTDASNNLSLVWNENDTSDRTLNFLVSGGTRSLTIEADSLLNQDLTTDATPTFAGLIGSGLTASRLLSTSAGKALTSTALNSWVTGTANRLTITDDGDGTITLATPQDTHTGASPSFAGLAISGTTTFTPSATQAITAVGDAILANATTVVLNPDGDYILTSTPTIADGTTGQILYVTCASGEGNIVTVQDEGALGGSNIQLLDNAVSRAVTGGGTISFRFDGTYWCEFGGGGGGVTNDFIYVGDITPTGDGTANVINDFRIADPTANRLFNRSTGVSDTQDMDWYTEYVLPKNCAGITTIKVYTRSSDFANSVMTMTLEDQDSNADATGAVVITPSGDDTWEEFTYTPTSVYTSLEHIWIKVSMTSLDTGDSDDFGGFALVFP